MRFRGLGVVVGLVLFLASGTGATFAQGVGGAGTIEGVVKDPLGVVVPDAVVEIQNPVSGYQRSRQTDRQGRFSFSNVPPNPYHLTVTKESFTTFSRDLDVRSSVPVAVDVSLAVGISEAVTVEASNLLEQEPTSPRRG